MFFIQHNLYNYYMKERDKTMKEKTIEYLSYIFHVATIVLYFTLLFALDDPPSLPILNYLAFIFLGLGIIFLVMSLRQHQGKDNQAMVFDSSVYGLVRHPMYLGAIFFFIAMVCFLPHWIMMILSPLNILLIYRFMPLEEKKNIEKFGEPYRNYMMDVPRINLLVGIIKWIKRKRNDE